LLKSLIWLPTEPEERSASNDRRHRYLHHRLIFGLFDLVENANPKDKERKKQEKRDRENQW
jgi:hypothetical protein